MIYLLAALATVGHWAIAIFVINRLHATALPYRMMKAIDLLWYAFVFLIPMSVFAGLIWSTSWSWLADHETARRLALIYVTMCWSAVPLAIVVWIHHLTEAHITPRLEVNHTERLNVVEVLGKMPAGSLTTSLAARLPTNQVFELWVQQKTLRLPRLDPTLEGLSIAHLSDLHFTGRVTRPYYDLIVDQANAMTADLMVISGDIIDKEQCFPWLADVLGRLTARHGVFFVLGNHDLRIRDEVRLRTELVQQGLIDLGGRWESRTIHGKPIVMAGNELPWFAPAANMREIPAEIEGQRPLRIAVSHSPDQFPWARQNDVDLMLAGHTHGGQIRFPVIGPVFSPSRYGVKYSAGTFFQDPTLMHVSRGLSGTRPLRFNCAPELSRLILSSDRTS